MRRDQMAQFQDVEVVNKLLRPNALCLKERIKLTAVWKGSEVVHLFHEQIKPAQRAMQNWMPT